MALLIKKPIQILGGITINELYLRFFYSLDFGGKSVHVAVQKYVSSDAYHSNNDANSVKISGINDQYTINYDRGTDGVDLLAIIHDKISSILSTPKTQKIQKKDDSGNPVFDSKTNKPVFTENVIVPAFADPDEISIVDL